MFDHVGRGHGRKRSLPALLLTVALNGGAIGSLALLTRHVAETVVATVEEPLPRFVEIELPKVPAPTPSGGGARPAPRRPRQVDPPVVAPPVVAPSLTPALPDPLSPLGPADPGSGGGLGVGPGSGPGTGPSDGPGEGVDGGRGLRGVHWSEVRVRHRVLPDFPENARSAGIREADCIVLFRIDGEGVPTAVVPQTCPAAFAPSAVAAAMKWRFEPLPGHVPAKFALTLQYRTK